jgi:hypothetical protein
VALQTVAVENGCQLPAHGVDGSWGAETALATECLAARLGWPYVIENWPWVPNRPQDEARPQVSSISSGPDNRELLVSWGAAMFSLVAIITMGSWLSSYAEKQRAKRAK